MLYENVKYYAEKKNMSIAELEKRAELSNGTIGKWQDAMPRTDSLMRVSQVLQVKVDTLLKGV